MSEHTKTPWLKPCADEVGVISKEDDQTYGMRVPILTCYSVNAEADADFIVHCVNNHERLVAQLEEAKEFMEVELTGTAWADCRHMAHSISTLLATLEAEKGGE